MFPYQPALSQFLDPAVPVSQTVRTAIGDIQQPWIDLGQVCGVSAFAAKALFSLGMMRRYILSANAVLKELRFHGFLSAFALLSNTIELLGRCTHLELEKRQHPTAQSTERLKAGFEFVKNPRLQAGVIVETNHYIDSNGGYNTDDLINLRNLAAHGACIVRVSQVKADIELLHNLRVLIYGVPFDELDPHLGQGPYPGALDRYYQELVAGNKIRCDQLATAAISPSPTRLQGGNWPLSAQVVNEINQHIQRNLSQGDLPVSGGYTKTHDYFQLYPYWSLEPN
jgi:hypothetical protein